MDVSRFIGAVVGAFVLGLAPDARGQAPIEIETGSTASEWKVITAEGVRLNASNGVHVGRPCLKIEFEFVTGGGFGIVQREVNIELPANYEFAFAVRADAGTPENNLELKLLDDKGENVWWVNRRAFAFPAEWTTLRSRRRHFEFAWGPSGGAPLAKAAKMEFAIASAKGGKGTIYLDDVTFRPLAVPSPLPASPKIVTTANECTVDLGQTCEFDGAVIRWPGKGGAGEIALQTSDDGTRWVAGPAVAPAAGGWMIAHAPDSQARFLRFSGAGAGFDAAGLKVEMIAGGAAADINGLVTLMAANSAEGMYPRWASRQQIYWTVLGLPDNPDESLLSEDGALEVRKRGISLEPFVVCGGETHTWAGVQRSHTLAGGVHPVAAVTRVGTGLELKISAGVAGEGLQGVAVVEYRLTNQRAERAKGTLVVAARPLQVNPPWQALNTVGGAIKLERVRVRGPRGLDCGEQGLVFFSAGMSTSCTTVERFAASPAAEGKAEAFSGQGLAMGLGRIEFDLGPGETRVAWAAAPQRPLTEEQNAAWERTPEGADAQSAGRILRSLGDRWAKNAAERRIVAFPNQSLAARVAATVQTQLDAIAINADGPAIQPGSRCYERSWARDGAMTSVSLLQWGEPARAKAWIEWYFAKQFESGKVPCVVDERGPDPVNEHDSTGQLIYALAEYHRFTGDKAFVESLYPRVQRGVAFLESLRNERTTAEFQAGAAARQEPGKRAVPATAFYGLVPESISHEGYSAKPMHSYWDDFFVLRGFKDATYLARVAGDGPGLAHAEELTRTFRRDLLASISAAMKAHEISYIPGCVELGDFDATSTATAVSPGGELPFLPRGAVDATFDKWWSFFKARRDGSEKWGDYTPYELRTVGVMVELGERGRAIEMLEWYFGHQRPQGWNHWAEVVTSDERQPRFIGDMPHTWVGSDFLRSVRTMIAYEQESENGETLVLLGGVPEGWMRAENGVVVDGLPTHFGTVSIKAVGLADRTIRVEVSGLLKDAGRFRAEIVNPSEVLARRVRVNGREVAPAGRIAIDALPAKVEFEYPR